MRYRIPRSIVASRYKDPGARVSEREFSHVDSLDLRSITEVEEQSFLCRKDAVRALVERSSAVDNTEVEALRSCERKHVKRAA